MEIKAQHKYIGFLSYAHADEVIASRLHRALETYPIPKSLELIDVKKLSPIFRDATELTAHHDLSEKIREAVQRSKYLIVLCSPAAKQSHWVNEEVRLFRTLHGESSILCVLAEGTPETSFPPALLEGGREPLAANLGGGKDSFKLGTTQLAASMLGVGLDTLIQRDTKRRRRRLQLITASALAFSGVMGVTAFTAVEARNDAQGSRAQAEGLVEYMITDLKDKLEPVGRLDILDGVGDEVVNYYNNQDISKVSDDSLARQAHARHIIGQVALDAGRMDDAEREVKAASVLTRTVLERNQENQDAIYAHSQSEYWLGAFHFYRQNFDKTRPHWEIYDNLSQKLLEKDADNIDWMTEAAFAQSNLGTLSNRTQKYDAAELNFVEAVRIFSEIKNSDANNTQIDQSLSISLSGAADIAFKLGKYEAAKKFRTEESTILENLIKIDGEDKNLTFLYTIAQLSALKADIQLNIETCTDGKVYQLLSDLKRLTEHDPSNYSWSYNYVDQQHFFIKSCHKFMGAEKVKNEIDKTLNDAKTFLEKTDIIPKISELKALMKTYSVTKK